MKQIFKLVNLFLVILLVSFTSCTNDLSEKDSQMSFSFTLPQEKLNRTTDDNNDKTLWNVTAVIENKKDIIQKIEQSGYSGETVTITFNQIIIGQKVRINIDLTQDGETTPSYTGSSDWLIVKNGNNKINIKLNKIEIDTPKIIDATIPEIITQPESIVEIATSGSTETITKTLSVNATSTDGGTLSFIWQEKNDNNEWTPYTTTTNNDNTTCSIDVTVNKGQDRTFRCIITNTNNSVNGNTTATVETNEVTVAYVEGALTSITAQYKEGKYETFGSNFTYRNVTVTEEYTNESNDVPAYVTVTANDSRYTISPTKDAEKAIGFVPYTVSCISSTNITTNLTVPVKYQLNANDFVITGSNQNNGNQEKIAQFTENTTLEVVTSAASNIPNKIYNNENSATAEDYEILQNLQSVWKKTINNQTTDFTDTKADNSIAGTYIYTNTLTVPTENSWCFGGPIELEYYVQVCPWTIALKTSDGNTVDLNNLTEKTNYTLSATNEADENPSVTFTSDNNAFAITNNTTLTTLTTPTATTSDQTATITAKVDNNKEVGSVKVTVKTTGGTGGSGTTYLIGDLYSQNNTPMGVVFEVADTYIKIVALEDLISSNESLFKLADKGWIDDETYPIAYFESDGSINSDGFLEFAEYMSEEFEDFNTETELPAFHFTWNYYVSNAENPTTATFTWYIPSSYELEKIVKDETGKVAQTLSENGSTLLNGSEYWSSTLVTETTNYSERAYYIGTLSKVINTASVDTSKYVRPIKKITFE